MFDLLSSVLQKNHDTEIDLLGSRPSAASVEMYSHGIQCDGSLTLTFVFEEITPGCVGRGRRCV